MRGAGMLEVIPAADHFQNGWKSKIPFQRLASGCTDDVASEVCTHLYPLRAKMAFKTCNPMK
jgi:hypothetical protein